MTNHDCVTFLQAVLPQLGLRWPGFRKVRRQLCKRLDRRRQALGLPDLAAYRTFLERHPAEWVELRALCRITISRFYRDRDVFDRLQAEVLPALAEATRQRGETTLRCWSVGCASGEEPYSLKLVWQLAVKPHFPELTIAILATDSDPHLLDRAQIGCYPVSSLKELPPTWRQTAFTRADGHFCLQPLFKTGVTFTQQDIHTDTAAGPFELILCRNLVFTYFDKVGQQDALARLAAQLRPGGALVIGRTEQLPPDGAGLAIWDEARRIYRRQGSPSSYSIGCDQFQL